MSKCFENYGIDTVPQVLLVNKEGIIVQKSSGFKNEKELEESIQTLLEGKQLQRQIDKASKLAQEYEKRRNRQNKTELQPNDIYSLMNKFDEKLTEVHNNSSLK